jgi:hypothetical protein
MHISPRLLFLSLALACGPSTSNDDADTSSTTADTSTTTESMPTTPGTSSTAADTAADSTTEPMLTDANATSGTSTAADSATDTTTTDTATTGACQPGELCPDDFGFVCIELTPGEGVTDAVFDGTLFVVVKLHYEPCLTTFYNDAHPEQTLDAPEGAEIVGAWGPRLCSEPIPGRVDCEISSISQSAVPPVESLVVDYDILDPAQLSGGKLLWGPAPLPAAAACDAGLEPRVKLLALDDIIGFDETGSVAWQLQSFGPTSTAVPSLTGDDCLQVAIAPT